MTAVADLTPPSGAETMTKSLIMLVAMETEWFFWRGVRINLQENIICVLGIQLQ